MRIFKPLAAAVLAIAASCHPGWAENYPAKPVRVIVADGKSTMDATARVLVAQLTRQTGQKFFVENHPGASGETGTALVVHAPPDGYTLLVMSDNLSLFPSTVKNLPFNVEKDLAPVSIIGALSGSFLIVSNTLPVHDLQELVAYSRAHELQFASSGTGGASYLRMVVLAKAENFTFRNTTFKSPGDQNDALIAGKVQAAFALAPSAVPLIKAGKVRAIAYDNATRDPALPDVPTMAEAGAPPGKIGNSWEAVFAPANTPQPIIAWLAAQIQKAVEDPATAQKLKSIHIQPVGSSPAELKQTLAAYVVNMHDALQAAGIQPE